MLPPLYHPQVGNPISFCDPGTWLKDSLGTERVLRPGNLCPTMTQCMED